VLVLFLDIYTTEDRMSKKQFQIPFLKQLIYLIADIYKTLVNCYLLPLLKTAKLPTALL
jgi:hypothetical protein